MTTLMRAKEGFGLGQPADKPELLKAEAKAVKDLERAQAKLANAKASKLTRADAQQLVNDVQAAQAALAKIHRGRTRKGRMTMVKQGENYSADHPAVKAHPDKFEDSAEWVEQATAAPGELRVNRPRTRDNIIKPPKQKGA